jgi:hypothetical protein
MDVHLVFNDVTRVFQRFPQFSHGFPTVFPWEIPAQWRLPLVPAARRKDPIEAAMPKHTVLTSWKYSVN